MKSVFDSCCNMPQNVNNPAPQPGGMQQQTVTTTVQNPVPQQQQSSQEQQGYHMAYQQQQQPQQHPQQHNVLDRIEEKIPMMAPFTNAMRGTPANTQPAQETSRLESNVVTGQGEEKQSYGEAITRLNMPNVAIFPANAKTALATIRALTGFPNRNLCSKIQCIVREESDIPEVRGELNEHLTDSVSYSFADFEDERSMTSAFMGVDRLLLIAPNTENRAELICSALSAAKVAGVPHIVLLSAIAAMQPQSTFGKQFRKMEERLESLNSPVSNYTIMRMAWFMDNFLDMAPDIVSNNRFVSSWGPSSVSAVAIADIGRSAAAVLATPKNTSMHYGRTYHLTGPESLSGFRMAEIFTKVLGRPISYQDLPREEMKTVYSEGMKLSDWQVEGYLEMNDLFKSGAGAAYSTDVAMLTRGNHTTLERFIRNKRWYFTGQYSPLICLLPGSGRVGSSTLNALMNDSSNGRIRAIVRSETVKADLEAKFQDQSRLEVILGDLENPDSIHQVLQGVDNLLIIPPEKLERFSMIDEAIKTAKNVGVNHTVLFSVSKAFDSTAIGRKFSAWEHVLEQNSYSYTIIRSSLFQDLMFHFAEQVRRPQHQIHHWLGSGRFCPVDARDVGEACASVLREGPLEHHGHAYSLYGPQAVNFGEMAQTLGKVLGYPVEAVSDVTPEQVRATLQGKLPSFNVEEVVQAHEAVALGNDTAPTPDLIKLAGHARTVQAFFEDYKGRFEQGTAIPTVAQT